MRYIRYCINLATAALFMVLNRLLALFCPVKKGRMMFISDVRGEIGGNLEFVYNELKDTCECLCYFKPDRRKWTSFGRFCRLVYGMTTAEVVFLEDYFRYTSYFKVRNGQKICQLWHGAGAFKKFGYSRIEGSEHIKIHKGYRKYTNVITSAPAINHCYAEGFGVPEDRVRATGIPRTDIFFDPEYLRSARERITVKYPILKERKVILFAPTYRGLRADDASYDFGQLPLEKLYNALHEEYVFVLKWHPALYNNIAAGRIRTPDFSSYPDFFLDLSSEREINDLLVVTDVLITDYSSVIFDYFLTGGKIVYYPYDFDTYYNGRSFYFDYEEYLYGPVAKNPDQLIEAIREDLAKHEAVRGRFNRKFMEACDGHSTERVCSWVLDRSR